MTRIALLLVLLAAGCAGGSADVGDSLADLEARMLRLSDLPEGFRYGDDRGCAHVGTTEGDHPEIDDFLVETRPRGCLGDFSREWGGEPRAVQTILFAFDSEEHARRAWALRRDLLGSFAAIRVTTERGHGDAVVFDSVGVFKRGAGEAWRDGRLVVAVYEEGVAGDAGRAFAAEIAAKQQERIASPSDPAADDDREVALEDPAIAIPVYWLGREFAPEGLPKLTLEASAHLRGADGPGSDVKIDYSGGVTLDLWRPEAWRRFVQTPLGRLVRCDEGQRVCRAPIGHWLAQVRYDDEAVVAVNMPYCLTCRRPAADPYNSRRAVEAVVRGLHRR